MPALRLLSALAALVLAAAPPALAADRALIIGIDRYALANDLLGAENDARNMGRFAEQVWGYSPDQIKVLLSEDATHDNILSALENWLVKDTAPGDRVLLYYAGHGDQTPDTNGDESDRMDEGLAPFDTALGPNNQFQNMVVDDDVAALLSQLTDRDVTVIIDSCHSGTISRAIRPAGGGGNSRSLRHNLVATSRSAGEEPAATREQWLEHLNEVSFLPEGTDWTIWTAVTHQQLAQENLEAAEPEGLFTGLFLRGVVEKAADANGNGLVTHAELLEYVQAESAAYCRRHPGDCDNGVTPTLEAPVDRMFADVATGRSAGTIHEQAQEALTHQPTTAATATTPVHLTPGGGAWLRIAPSQRVRLGEAITLEVTSPVAGFLIVLDIDPQGRVTQIYPNQFAEQARDSNWVPAGMTLRIPDPYYGFEFRAEPPTGRGLLLAVVSQDPPALGDLLAANQTLDPVADPQAYLGALAQALRATWRQDDNPRRLRWALAETPYEIVR